MQGKAYLPPPIYERKGTKFLRKYLLEKIYLYLLKASLPNSQRYLSMSLTVKEDNP